MQILRSLLFRHETWTTTQGAKRPPQRKHAVAVDRGRKAANQGGGAATGYQTQYLGQVCSAQGVPTRQTLSGTLDTSVLGIRCSGDAVGSARAEHRPQKLSPLRDPLPVPLEDVPATASADLS
jgi:hypothetical protein